MGKGEAAGRCGPPCWPSSVISRTRAAAGDPTHRPGPPVTAPPNSLVTDDLAPVVVAASGVAINAMLLALTVALLVVAVLLVVRLRADRRRELASRRDRAVLAAAYAELATAKSAAEARSAQLEATLSGMSDGVMMLDAESRLVQWNDRFAELTGVPRAMLRVGVAMEDMIRAQARAGEFGPVDVEAEVARRINTVRTFNQSAVVERTRPNGQVVELRRNPGPSGGSVTLYTDITARRRAEEAQRIADRATAELVEQKAQFVAIVSHEVAIPLEAVLESLRQMAAQMVPAGGGDPSHLALRQARAAADTLAALMRDILDMTRMDAGWLTLREADFALRPLLAEAAADFTHRAAARGIVLEVEAAPDLIDRLHGDAGRVRQVLANFLANAVAFADPGVVSLRATRLDLGEPMLRLSVTDPGPRIPAEQAARLFQPFARPFGPPPLQGEALMPGAGLGLAICARLARMMRGQVGLAPVASGGNEFWITLPLAAAHAEAADAPAVDAEPPRPDPRRAGSSWPESNWPESSWPESSWPESSPRGSSRIESGRLDPARPEQAGEKPAAGAPPALRRARRVFVLLVEDMVVNQVVTATQLRRDGHRVEVAARGSEAVRLAASRPYDIVFMDLMMPGMSGYEAARQIRQLPPPAGLVPIYALTATTSAGDRARCLAAGMQGMLSKPVRLADLAEVLARGATTSPAPPEAAPPEPPSPEATGSAPPPPQPPQAQPADLLLDAGRLAELQQGLPRGVFVSLAEQCVADMREQMMDLHEALETGAPSAIDATAHALAGMAGNYGMQALERRMRRLMAAARTVDVAAARAAAVGMDRELDRTDAALSLLLRVRSA